MSRPDRSNPAPARQVSCPSCGEPALFAPSNPWRPFCSERCRNVDLGAWASERYRVGSGAAPGEAGEDDAPQQAS